MTNDLVLVSPDQDSSWQQIIDNIILELDQEDIPEKVIRAMELLLSGFPTIEVASELGVKKETVNRWLVRYPQISAVMGNHQSSLIKWRMAQIDKQFLKALAVSDAVLSLPLYDTDVNAKLVGIQAAQARYIIGLRAGQKQDITVTHEMGDSVMQARNDALDYLSQQLLDQRVEEPIETTYRIVDETKDDSGPFVMEDGSAPFGEVGILDKDDEGMIICHACGKRYKSVKRHALATHNLSSTEYELLYGLEEGSLRRAETKKHE